MYSALPSAASNSGLPLRASTSSKPAGANSRAISPTSGVGGTTMMRALMRAPLRTRLSVNCSADRRNAIQLARWSERFDMAREAARKIIDLIVKHGAEQNAILTEVRSMCPEDEFQK